jgi:hypothetical protein
VDIVQGGPAAFMSYVRFNDQHDDGQLTEFRKRLSNEVRVQVGEAFPIFQDRNDIAWGQNWEKRIDQALDAVTLLVVIITPGFFRSAACRAEVEHFMAREQELGREGLIMPVYYVSTPELDDPRQRDADPLAKALAARQFADWRELRFEPFTSPVVRKALAQLAARMRDTFWRPPPDAPPPDTPPRPGKTGEAAGLQEGAVSAEATTGKPPAELPDKKDPPTHVVGPSEQADFATVGAAIEAAQPGDRILVRPGLYQEGLVRQPPITV